MQHALRMYNTDNPDPEANQQARQLRALDALNILAFRRGGAAPVPTSHDDERGAVVRALEWASTDSPIAALIKADVALMFQSSQSLKLLWGSLTRLCATGLSGLRMRVVLEEDTQSLLLWSTSSDSEAFGGDPEEFYQITLLNHSDDPDNLTAVFGLINEALESRDAYGRLYRLPGEHSQPVIGYFTDAEVALLEEYGIEAEWA